MKFETTCETRCIHAKFRFQTDLYKREEARDFCLRLESLVFAHRFSERNDPLQKDYNLFLLFKMDFTTGTEYRQQIKAIQVEVCFPDWEDHPNGQKRKNEAF